MRIKLNIFILSAVIYFALPSVSDAAWEYITHGGYDAAVNAWKRTALIFSDNGYKGLFISAIVLGAITIFASTYIRIAIGARAGGLSWATPVIAGMAIYAAFIAPKDKLIIYDELLNRGPEEVDGIPLILATSAGMLNKIEKGFIDIVSTSSDPASDYRLNAGGTGWALLDTVSVTSLLSPNEFSTISRFVLDCVYFELNREGTNLDLNKIASGEQKYDTIIMESANPVLYTVVYTDNSVGTTTTCYNAAQQVASIINTAKINQESLKTICSSRGFNSSGASLNACSNLMESTLQYTLPNISSGTGLALYNAQRIMAEIFLDASNSKSPSVSISKLATSQTQSQFIGLGVHANSWIPVLKESLTSVAISITPLLLLFAATPIAGRALSLVLGMFVWLALWGIIDAVVHGFGMDLAQQASQMMRANSLDIGFKAMYMWPDYTARVAATFGALRWSGLMLASVISGMLVKFGGTALAMLAGSISGMPQSSGAAYGSSLLKNAGGVLQSEILPTQTWSNAAAAMGGSRALMSGLAEKGAGELRGQAMFGSRLGANRIAQATEGNLLSGAASGIATLNATNRLGFDNVVKGQTASLAEQYAKNISLYNKGNGIEGAIIRGDTSGEMHVGSFPGIEDRRQVLSNAALRIVSYGKLSSFESGGGKVVSYGNGKGYVQLGSGAIVFTDGGNNYALLGMDAPVRSSISEGVAYKQSAQALRTDQTTKKFADSIMNKWFDSTSGEYREQTGEQFRNVFSQSFGERLASSESLSKTLGFKKNEISNWQIDASGGMGISFSGPNVRGNIDFKTGVMTRYDKSTGIESKSQLTSEQINEIKTAFEQAKQEGWDYVVSNRSGFEYVRSKSKEFSYNVSESIAQQFEKSKSFGENLDLNSQNAIFHQYVLARYGAVNVDTVAQADSDLRKMSTAKDYGELWKYINKPITGVNPQEVETQIQTIGDAVYKEGAGLSGQKLVNPTGNPESVNSGVNLNIERPDFGFVKGKKQSVHNLVERFNNTHENTGALGLMIVNEAERLAGPVEVLTGYNPLQNKNPLNLKNEKFRW
ncbi:conjugal transfer protein TraG N-terminal domain-containing protein [Thermodesulfovibrio sp. 1176]|uniref:conjugal transfer protein TraG N-terminal domain-containing protein n=1 Tax=Thermodesulfovibrio sp. 1176 TaxID=3043424 RepID=UPI0024829BF9|nr:conjugal transfer protein TraG N-terminal domain-containing protein [Thermodesulfovibrio sp. 1176]MDI1472966.1 conjugal transfer protein TraG N-terminal domain-containing protein [Thermodesulfovibrio sp. 1176]